jgi:hypothetical protein
MPGHARIPARLLLVAALAAVATGSASAVPASDPATHRPRSSDDRGFSIILVSPDDDWLAGRQTIAIEAIIPRSDTIAQVDFFLDGKLVTVDNKPPYSVSAEFGAEFRRHEIEVRAVTREGRRARVSLVTRSADASDRAAGSIVSLPATVRDRDGHPVDRLSVGDFVLEEDGVRQTIVQFRSAPSPASIALAVDPALQPATVRAWLAGFLGALPRHQAVALDAGAVSGEPAFTFEPESLLASLDTTAAEAASVAGLAERITRDASAVQSRRGPRLMVILAAATPVGEEPAGPPAPPNLAPASVALLGARAGAAGADARKAKALPAAHPAPLSAGVLPADAGLPEDPLAAALEEARRAAVVHVVAFPASDRLRYDEAQALARLLQESAETSGGRFVEASDPERADATLRELLETIRHQYVLAYMPHPGGKTGWRTLRLAVPRDDLAVEAPRAVYMGP